MTGGSAAGAGGGGGVAAAAVSATAPAAGADLAFGFGLALAALAFLAGGGTVSTTWGTGVSQPLGSSWRNLPKALPQAPKAPMARGSVFNFSAASLRILSRCAVRLAMRRLRASLSTMRSGGNGW